MSYRENTAGMVDAMNQKRDKYLREQRKNAWQQDRVTDLTYLGGDSLPLSEENPQPMEGETIVTHYNNDGSVKSRTSRFEDGTTRSFRSRVNTQSDKSKKSGVHSKLAQDSEDTTPLFMTIPEDGKTGITIEDEYEKHNPDPSEDRKIEATGATILHSEVVLTDSSGNNRTYVRRNDV